MIFDKFTAACVMLELSDKLLQNTDDYEDLFLALIYALFRWSRGRFPTRGRSPISLPVLWNGWVFSRQSAHVRYAERSSRRSGAFSMEEGGKSVGNAFHMWLPFLYPGPHF